MSESLMHKRENREICRRLFLKGYNVPVPFIVLNKIVHWQAQMDLIKVHTDSGVDFGKRPAWLLGGYFYNFSTPALSEEEIHSGLEEGSRHGAETFLVPTVRDSESTDSLRAAGFLPLPCFIESVFDLENSLETDFRKRVSRNRFAKIRQAARRAREAYDLRFYKADELKENSHLLAEVSRLHGLNVRDNVDVNIYNTEVLRSILSSSLKNNLLVGLRYAKGTNAVVQAVVCFLCKETRELYALAHGIDHDVVSRRGQNLFTALFFELFTYAEENGLKTIYMGRGGESEKQRLGASRYYLLNHWLKSNEKNFKNELKKLADAALGVLNVDVSLIL